MTNLLGILVSIILILAGSKRFTLSKKQTIYLFTIVGLIPLWWNDSMTWNTLFKLATISIGWSIYLLLNNKYSKFFLLIFLGGLSLYFILTGSQILNRGNIDLERSYWVDNKSVVVLDRFRAESLFLPYRIRNVMWGHWWQIIDIFQRSLSGLGDSNMWTISGIALWFMMIMSFFYGINYSLLVVIWIIFAFGWIARNPNLSLIGVYLIPLMLVISSSVIKKINFKLQIAILILAIPFIFK